MFHRGHNHDNNSQSTACTFTAGTSARAVAFDEHVETTTTTTPTTYFISTQQQRQQQQLLLFVRLSAAPAPALLRSFNTSRQQQQRRQQQIASTSCALTGSTSARVAVPVPTPVPPVHRGRVHEGDVDRNARRNVLPSHKTAAPTREREQQSREVGRNTIKSNQIMLEARRTPEFSLLIRNEIILQVGKSIPDSPNNLLFQKQNLTSSERYLWKPKLSQ